VICGIDGHWTTGALDISGIFNASECSAVECGEPSSVQNAYVSVLGGYSFQVSC